MHNVYVCSYAPVYVFSSLKLFIVNDELRNASNKIRLYINRKYGNKNDTAIARYEIKFIT